MARSSNAALKKRLLNDPTAHARARARNQALDEEDVLDAIVLTAVNDGDAYRDNKNAKRAVESAMADYRARMAEDMRETFSSIRAGAIKEVTRQWRGR